MPPAAPAPADAPATAPADADAADAPTLITLHVNNASPQTVLDEICKQAHTDIHIWPEQMWTRNMGQIPQVTLDLDKAPFWTALAAFCDQANCRTENMGNNIGITLMQGRSGSGMLGGKVLNCGLATLVATGASHDRSISYADNQVSRNDSLQFTIYFDPKLKIVSLNQMPMIDSIEDDNGVSMLASAPNAPQSTFDGEGQFKFQLQVPLAYPDKPGQKIAHLQGMIIGTAVAKTESIVFDDLAAAVGTSKSAGGRTVEIKAFSVNGTNAQLQLLVSKDATAINTSRNIFSELRTMKVTDINGESQSLNGGGGGNDQQINWQCNFQLKAGNTAKFSWDIVTETKDIQIPFEFQDLPLPTE